MSDAPNLTILAIYAERPGPVWHGHRHWSAVNVLYRHRLVRMIPRDGGLAQIEVTDAGRAALEAKADA